jgi:signal transduction histidine kinase
MTVEGAGTLALDASQRRNVFLIFKECIHNSVRHSGCNLLTASVGIDHKRLSVRITANGKGFAEHSPENGSGAGLESIRRRSARLQAKLEITSGSTQGTSVHLFVPLGKRDYINV